MSNLQSTSRFGDVMLNLRHNFSDDFNAALTLGSSINDIKVTSLYADSKGPGLYYANTFVIQNIKQPGANITQSQPNRSTIASIRKPFFGLQKHVVC